MDSLRHINPEVKVLAMAGVDVENLSESGVSPTRMQADGLIGKPFGVSDLLDAVRAVLPE